MLGSDYLNRALAPEPDDIDTLPLPERRRRVSQVLDELEAEDRGEPPARSTLTLAGAEAIVRQLTTATNRRISRL